ncbi:MAG: hypothetical protein J0J01_17105 [Reyranella sp.]|uniref:hypothetical protein n=1 Tax=Reyranella sp. TaxID=1929291 RepID=UPI001AC84F59|nr:hypothetical protein [Reyranella sp.]MBN9088624.1 hypothetical protein [Reyranella sp.]
MKVILSHNAERDPRAHPFVDRARDPTLRRRVHGNCLIFDDVSANAVDVLHALHGARDFAQIVFPGEPE